MDRGLTEIESALLRISNNARARADDIKHTQKSEDHEYLTQLDLMLHMVDRVRQALLDQRQRFNLGAEVEAADDSRPLPNKLEPPVNAIPKKEKPIPSFLMQGPK